MTHTTREELFRAELLLKKGEYKDALELVEKIAVQEGLPEDDRLTCSLLESRLRVKLGELEKALALAEEVLQKFHERKNLLLGINALIIKAEISWRSGNLDEGLKAVEEGEELLVGSRLDHVGEWEEQIKRRKGELLQLRGVIYWYKGDLDQALECHQRSLAIKKDLDDKQSIADSFNNLGLVYCSKGNLDQALEYHQRSLVIWEELGNRMNIAKSLNNLGNAYQLKGDLDQALECIQQSLLIKEELGNRHDIALTVNNLGVIYQLKGDLDRALEYYQRSLAISEELGSRKDIALVVNNLGEIYRGKGDLDQALEYYQRSLAISEELGIKQDIAMSLGNIGDLYRKKGNSDLALEYYQQSLAIYEKIGNDPSTAIVLYELVWVTLDNNDPSLAQQYLQKLQQINERTDNRIIDQRYRVAKALSLKTSKRARHKVKAEEILEQVVEEEVADHSLTVTAMIHLCELLLFELKMTGEEEVLEEVKDLTHRLLDIAKQQSSHLLLAETYLLQSKFALMELDVERARKLLAQAHIIAEEKGLHMLARTVAHERDLLQSQLHKWERIIKQTPSRRKMIDLTQLDDLLERTIQKTVAVLTREEMGISGEEIPKKKYELVYLDLLKDSPKIEKNKFRVAIAQIGLSQTGDILSEFYEEESVGLLRLRKDKIETIENKVKEMIENAHSKEINVLLLPEMIIDLNSDQLLEDVINLAKNYNMYIIPGSSHDLETKRNISVVIGPDGILWRQEKHNPAIIHYQGKRFKEGIKVEALPRKTFVCRTEFGTIVITICRDFLDMDLRVELKNSDSPVDLIFNPAFTPVTADFRAAHFDARRSIYAYCFFANVAEFGDSFIYTPEKERVERKIPPKEEGLIFKDINLFRLRSERKKWEKMQKKFIQSTR